MKKNSAPILVDGSTLTDRKLRKGMKTTMAGGCLAMAYGAVTMGMPLTMMMEALGATGVMIGMLGTLTQLAWSAHLPGAFLSRRIASRKRFWMPVVFSGRAIWFLPVVILLLLQKPSVGILWALIALYGINQFLTQIATPAWLSWMADLVPDHYSGRFWGKRQSYSMTAFLFAIIAAGYTLDRFNNPENPQSLYRGFAWVFLAATILGILETYVIRTVPEPVQQATPRRIGWFERIIGPLREYNFRWLTFSMGAWYFSVGLMSAFGQVYLKREYGINYSDLAALTVSASLGMIVAGFLWGYVIDKIGPRAFGLISLILAPLTGIAWFFLIDTEITLHLPLFGEYVIAQPVLLMLGANFLVGMMHSGVGLSNLSLAANLAPRDSRTMAMAVHWLTMGMLAALGPFFGGMVMDYFKAHPLSWATPTGGPFAYMQILIILHIASAWFISTPLLMKIEGRRGELPARTAFARYIIINPFRAASSIYNIVLMSTTGSKEKRARAARELGEHKTAIAVEDLIKHLDDPSTSVREESVSALGNIGSPEAVAALIRKLEDPESDLAPQIARALRRPKSPNSVLPLIQCLSIPDRETQCEAARTLGEIGDRMASKPLLGLLARTKDSKVLTACSEALARLGENAAIPKIYSEMQARNNPLLKRSLAISIADLIGDPERFYGILTREENVHAEEAETLLADLRKQVASKNKDENSTLEIAIRSLEYAYEEQDYSKSCQLAYEIAVELALRRYGPPEGADDESFVRQLARQDERFGQRLWLLQSLAEKSNPPQTAPPGKTETLLAIHCITSMKD